MSAIDKSYFCDILEFVDIHGGLMSNKNPRSISIYEIVIGIIVALFLFFFEMQIQNINKKLDELNSHAKLIIAINKDIESMVGNIYANSSRIAENAVANQHHAIKLAEHGERMKWIGDK